MDPFLGVGTSIIAALRHERKGAGAEIVPRYVELAKERINQEIDGTLKTRPMSRPVYDPVEAGNILTKSPWGPESKPPQLPLLKTSSDRQE
jgi:adenine-specific DNA-methyltransferase